MSRPAVILAHPALLASPREIACLEAETGMRCKRGGALNVRMVPMRDVYEQTERDSWLGRPGAFLGDAA